MTSELQSELLRATLSTFECLGFVVPETEIEDHHLAPAVAWGARVSFRGPAHGVLDIRVTDSVAAELAANMLGLHASRDPDMKRDAVGEIANVICGNFVPSLGHPEDVFDLTSPEVFPVSASDASLDADEGGVKLVVGIDGGRAELTLHVLESAAVEVAG